MKDISSWSMDRIMQLPDEAFGRRWITGIAISLSAASRKVRMIEPAVPDKIVIWSINFGHLTALGTGSGYKLAIGDNQPATEDGFNAMERILRLNTGPSLEEGLIDVRNVVDLKLKMRMPCAMGGRRFVILGVNTSATLASVMSVYLEISAMPKAIPEWLHSRME